MTVPRTGAALATAAREAERAARRHDIPEARALRDALQARATDRTPPDRAWIAATIRDAAAWATDDADVPLLAALGALARAVATGH